MKSMVFSNVQLFTQFVLVLQNKSAECLRIVNTFTLVLNINNIKSQ